MPSERIPFRRTVGAIGFFSPIDEICEVCQCRRHRVPSAESKEETDSGESEELCQSPIIIGAGSVLYRQVTNLDVGVIN
jgi:hypothetical protein